MTPDDLKRRALFLLKCARIPLRGPQYQRVLKSPEALGGAVAHHAAWLLHHADQIRLCLKSAAVEEAISQAVSAGRHLAMIDETQREKPRAITSEDEGFLAKAVRRRDKESYALDKRNAEKAVRISPREFDRLRKEGWTFEKLAERYGCSVQTIRNWRIKSHRLH